MKRACALTLGLLLISSLPAAAQDPSTLYEQGTAARKRGDHKAAKEAFARMLAQDPENGAALEGLGLACLSLGQYEEARGYLERWNAKSPRNPYILGMLARAQRGMGDDRAAFATSLELIDADPGSLDLRRRVDDTLWQEQPGLFLQGRIRKSVGTEELNTRNPQRIVYEGRTGGLRARVKASSALNLTAGAEYAEDAQRNDTRGFTYFDVLEQIYWMGLEYKPRRNAFLSGEYGQDIMSNAKANGLEGQTLFSRARLTGRARFLDIDWSAYAERAPYFLRGSGGSSFFALLRDDSAKVQADKDLWGWTWSGRAGVDNFSDGTTLKNWSLSNLKEFGPHLVQASYSHGQQVFFGASPVGRLGYALTDRYGARVRRLVDEKYQLSGGAGYTLYADANRAADASFDATGWLPWCKEFSGVYRFSYLGFLATPSGYNTNNQTDHWLGAYWQHGWGLGLWTRLGYEHGFRWDQIRQSTDGSEWLGDIEWYRRGGMSLKVQGRYGVSTVKDNHHSLGLQARYSFR